MGHIEVRWVIIDHYSFSNNYETSLFSLHSTGQDSGVEFLSSRELYETSPDSFQHSSSKRSNNPDLLCPRHAKAHMELRQHPNTDSRYVKRSDEVYSTSRLTYFLL